MEEKKKKTYYDYLFETTEEEKRISQEMDAEYEAWQNTKAYKEHMKRFEELHQKLIAAGEERRKKAAEYKPNRRENAKPIDLEKWKAEREEIRKKEFESFPQELKDAINAYNALDEDEKRKFKSETLCRYHDHEDYENPQTTEKDLCELLEILVQTTIDFIRERGLKDIDGIGFGADALQTSAENGEWVPATDANIYATGIGIKKGKDGREYSVIQRIGEYM